MQNDQQSLRTVFKPLLDADMAVAGNESLLSDVFSTVTPHIKNGLVWTSAQAAKGAITVFNNVENVLIKNLGTRRIYLSHLLNKVRKDGTKEDVTISVSSLEKITATGDIDELNSNLKYLSKVMKDIQKYELEVETYYKKELNLFKEILKVKDTDTALSVIQKLDSNEYPIPNFWDKNDSMFTTQVLPGNKIFLFNTQTNKFAIGSEVRSATETKVSFAKEEIVSLITELNQVIENYKVLSKCNGNYADYIRDFNTVAGKAFAHLEDMKGSVSINLLRDLQGRLEGNTEVFSFYTSFLPKVCIYLDDYVEALSSFLSKQIN